MLFIGGIDAKQAEIGQFDSVACPHCHSHHPMTLYKSFYFFHFFFLPLFRWNKKYFLTCHGCQSVFSINLELGKALELGQIHDIDPSALELVQASAGKPVQCLNCHQEMDPAHNFCPHCGQKTS